MRNSPTLRLTSSAAAPDERGELRPGEEDLLLALARLAKAVLPATSCTCLTLHEPTRTTRTLSDTALGQALDRAQRRAAAGPSLAAHQDGEPCCSTDLREDPRWRGLEALLPPSGAPRVAGSPHRSGPISAVALPLSEGARVTGVLTVYGDGHPLLTSEEDVAQLVTLGVVASQLVALLLRARRAEEVQVEGIVVAPTGVDLEEAFAVITSPSQRRSARDGLEAAQLRGLLAR